MDLDKVTYQTKFRFIKNLQLMTEIAMQSNIPLGRSKMTVQNKICLADSRQFWQVQYNYCSTCITLILWQVPLWRVPLWQVPLWQVPLCQVLLWQIPLWQVPLWHVTLYKVPLWQIPH